MHVRTEQYPVSESNEAGVESNESEVCVDVLADSVVSFDICQLCNELERRQD